MGKLIFLGPVTVIGCIIDYYQNKILHPRMYPFTFIISILCCTVLVMAFDNPVWIIKGLLFSELLIIVGYQDAVTHEIPNYFTILIMMVGLIGINPFSAITGFFSVSLIFLIAALLTRENGIGGGDIKLIAATGFVLGPSRVVGGTLVGFILFLIAFAIYYKRHKQQGYAMGPWLGAGCFFAYAFMN